MGSVQDIQPGASGQREASVHQCLLCHRVHVVYGDHQEGTEWEQVTSFVRHYWVRSPDFAVFDTYCDECTVFYRRLLIYALSRLTREESAINGRLTTSIAAPRAVGMRTRVGEAGAGSR
jgi:hypothetical protein